ncbi:MAG: TIR domain-containing protein [Candidatus Poribacteria bacterium]|nr:TIR domain-containing protein [Candidatus Poribacteria bacterium]
MNLFISHSWNYSGDYYRLKSLLENRGYFNFRNYSVENEDPKNNWTEIENNIKWSSIVIVIAGVYASYSSSIKKEIRLAQNHYKSTLAIIPWGSGRSSDLRNECDRVVGWNTESIVSAIRDLV